MASSSYCRDMGKGSWPELVGADGQTATKIIKNENPRLRVVVVKKGSFVTMDFRCDRVRVWVDQNGMVVQPPILG
ncbi:hypothetical protein ACHQM5_014414 [Ranunculus cassubicifolius]